MLSIQTVAIYRNRRSGEFRVQPYAKVGAGSQPFGEQTLLRRDASDDDLLQAVLENLAKNDRQSYSLSLAPVYSADERRRMLKEDQLIHIERSAERYRLIPFKKMRSSFGSIDDLATSIAIGDFQSQGVEMIRQLFRQIP